MKKLTATFALLVCVFTPTVFAQCVEQKERVVESIRGTEREYQNVSTFAPPVEQKDRFSVFSGWLEMVKSAERDYKNKNGRYGDLTALRKANLLRSLVFGSGSASGKAKANFVPKSTLFQVTVSGNGQHFRAEIGDDCMRVNADEMGREVDAPQMMYQLEVVQGTQRRDFEDGPEGPIISVAR